MIIFGGELNTERGAIEEMTEQPSYMENSSSHISRVPTKSCTERTTLKKATKFAKPPVEMLKGKSLPPLQVQ